MKNYPGQKKIYGLYHKIINQIPKHQNYYEVFAGSGAIAALLIEKNSSAKFYLNDIDGSVTDKLSCTFRQAKVSKIDATKLLNKLMAADTDTFIFMDPPYLHSTRPNNTKLYKHEMTDYDHKQLLSSVLQLDCNVMIVHPVCELYDTWLKGWRKVLIKVRYHNKMSLECLYMNYDLPEQLQVDAFLGTDCWDRQRIKRKATSLVNKLIALPELERNYIIRRVQENFA
ncbi:MAG: DNA adenine methylase [Bacteroidia bacterium]|nr:DNA adenine methylase [Bacteroidia bacterium]